jgi:hypothetical protein
MHITNVFHGSLGSTVPLPLTTLDKRNKKKGNQTYTDYCKEDAQHVVVDITSAVVVGGC